MAKYGLLVLLLVVLLGMLFLGLHGLPASLTRDIESQLQFGGMVLSLDKIKLGIFEGIIATRVRCHRQGDIGDPVFEAEKIVLKCDPQSWLQGAMGIKGARIKNGVLRLIIAAGADEPAANACPRLLMFDKLQAHVEWDQPQPSAIRVLDFSARLPGVNLTGRGVLNMPLAAAMPLPPPAAAGRAGSSISSPLSAIMEKCQTVRLRNAVNVDLVFQADASDIRKLTLCLKIDSRDTCAGAMSAGAWRARVSVRGRMAKGLLEIKNGSMQGVRVEEAVCRFACDDQFLTIEQLDAVLGRGLNKGPVSLSLKYTWESTEFEGRWISKINPRIFLPLLRRECPARAGILEAFQFAEQRPPAAHGAFKGRWQPSWAFKLDGQAQAYDMIYCGVLSSEAQVAVAVAQAGTNVVVTLMPLTVIRPEGLGQGWLRVDSGAQAVSFDAWSTLTPYALAPMIDPFIDRLVRQFRFAGPTQAAGWGTIGFADTRSDDMDLMLAARRAGWKMFLADTCSLDLRLLGDHIEITDIKGTIHEGRFDARAAVYSVLGSADARYEVAADLQDVDFEQVMGALMGNPLETYAGRLAAHVALEGEIGAGRGQTARGTGWVKISDGRIFQIPLFGGLSEFLTRIIPGMSALLRQTDAKASFIVEDGKIHSDEVLIEGDVLSLTGKGDYYLDGTLDFTVQVKLLRKHTLAADVFRFMTHPVSKMLEFQLSGTVDAPRWRPVNIPKAVFLMFD